MSYPNLINIEIAKDCGYELYKNKVMIITTYLYSFQKRKFKRNGV